MKRWFCLLGVVALSCSSLFAEDWPQWRGLNHDARSTEKGVAANLVSGTKPKLLWTFSECGHGFSSPSIQGDVAYILGTEGEIKETYKELLIALDVKTGKKLWQTTMAEYKDDTIINGWGHGPRGSAAVAGDKVYALGCLSDFICADAKTGKVLWKKNLTKDYGAALMQDGGVKGTWGFSESPIVDGDKVLVTPGGKKGTVLALNRNTGDTIWQSSDVTDNSTYSSIIPATIEGVKQYIQLGRKGLISLDAATGRLLWKAEVVVNGTAMIPTPVVSGNLVYATTAYGAGCACVKVSKEGDAFKANKLYQEKKLMENHHGGVVLHNGNIFGYSNSGRKWVLHGMESGKELASKQGTMGSVIFADGHFWCYSEKDGALTLFAAEPEGFNEVAQFKIPEASGMNRRMGKVWTHPVIANGKLYLRDLEKVFCLDLMAK